MPTNTEGVCYQANFKTPAGTLLNIYAQTAEEYAELLLQFETYLPTIAAIESKLGAVSTVAQVIPLAAPSQQPAVQAAPVVPASADGEHLCEHGLPMRLVPAGISKATGRPYRAFYACGQPRGQQCSAKITV